MIHTDEYLIPGASLERLIREYDKYGSLAIGLDFDNTVYDFHQKGFTYEKLINLIRDLKSIGCQICVWTANPNLLFVEEFLTKNNIPFDDINGDGIYLGWESRKPMHSTTLDDRIGLIQVYEELTALVEHVKSKKL